VTATMECRAASLPWLNVLTAEQQYVLTVARNAAEIHSAVNAMTNT
jgi:hypothetical protein